MSKVSDLILRYLHRKLSASKDTPTQYTAASGTVRTAVCAVLVEADDYWIGAIVRWDSGPNAGLYSSVGDFDADTDTLTFDEDLPTAVANGHEFTLLHGGKYASDQRIPGLKTATPANVTGFEISYAAMINGLGTGTLSFYYNGGSGQSLTWTPPGETEGVEVDVSALSEGQWTVLTGGGDTAEQRSKYLSVMRTAAALPTEDKQDDISLEAPTGSFLAGFTGDETAAGVTVYRPMVLENTAENSLYAVRAYFEKPFPDAENTVVAEGGGIGVGTGTLVGEDFTGWGAHGFIFNATKNDARYFYDRSGNTVQISDPDGGIRGKAAVAWEAGDILEPYPWFDIGLDAAGVGNLFEDPADEQTAPAGITFSAPRNSGDTLVIGDMAAGALVGIWQRMFIPEDFRPIESGQADLRFLLEVTE